MSPRVLIIEPHADLRAAITAMLTREQYTCDAVSSSAHAMLALTRHAYKYVLMEEESLGGELVSSIDPRSRVILITESATDAIIGADSTLQKPFGRDELIARFTH